MARYKFGVKGFVWCAGVRGAGVRGAGVRGEKREGYWDKKDAANGMSVTRELNYEGSLKYVPIQGLGLRKVKKSIFLVLYKGRL